MNCGKINFNKNQLVVFDSNNPPSVLGMLEIFRSVKNNKGRGRGTVIIAKILKGEISVGNFIDLTTEHWGGVISGKVVRIERDNHPISYAVLNETVGICIKTRFSESIEVLNQYIDKSGLKAIRSGASIVKV